MTCIQSLKRLADKGLRFLIDKTIKVLAWFKRKYRYQTSQTTNKINLGSGLAVADGWINIDASLNSIVSRFSFGLIGIAYKFSGSKDHYSKKEYCEILRNHEFVFYDLKYGLPFNDNSIDFIYTSHLLEHMFYDEAVELLIEAHRVLKNVGVIRINVPDLDYVIELFSRGSFRDALGYFFCSSKNEYLGRHQYLYNFEILEAVLKEIGFSEVRRCNYRTGKTPDIDILDNRPRETLFIEAFKDNLFGH